MDLKRLIRNGLRYVFDEDYRFRFDANRGKYDSLPDKEYLTRLFKAQFGYEIDWENPKTFNEKMQWLKLYNRKPEFTTMVDKYGAHDYVANKIGSEYLVPLLEVWDSPYDINLDTLPEQFVLKTTHGCGGMLICRDKSTFSLKKAQKLLAKSMKDNYYYHVREWPYKNVKPRVIAEKYMQNGDEIHLKVYKVFNFNGVPQIIQTIQNDKTKDESIDYFDTNWNLLTLRQNYPNSAHPTERPATLEKMLELSAICSEGFPFLRTDWYEVNGKVYFSEFTFFSDAGMERFYPDSWDAELGSRIRLPAEKTEAE